MVLLLKLRVQGFTEAVDKAYLAYHQLKAEEKRQVPSSRTGG